MSQTGACVLALCLIAGNAVAGLVEALKFAVALRLSREQTDRTRYPGGWLMNMSSVANIGISDGLQNRK